MIGITGHRNLRESALPALQAQVRTFLLGLRAHYPQLPLVLLLALAAGSDQRAAQVAQVARDLGLRVIARVGIFRSPQTRSGP